MAADQVLGPRAQEAQAVLATVANTPGVAKPDPVLIADDVVRRFGGLAAVDVARAQVEQSSSIVGVDEPRVTRPAGQHLLVEGDDE